MTTAAEQSEELDDIIKSFVAEIKQELGEQASVNEIEAALLKRQSSLMSCMMQHLVENQDFPPLVNKSESWHKDGHSELEVNPFWGSVRVPSQSTNIKMVGTAKSP